MQAAAVVAVSLATAASVGCTHQKDASTLPAGKQLIVETADGSEVVAAVDGNAQAINFRAPDGQIIAGDRVVRATEIKRGRGALEGLLGGAVTGLVVGAVIGYSDGDDECADDSDFCLALFSAEEKAAMGGAVLGLAGGLVGAVIGASVGSKNVYTFGSNQEYRVSAGGPAGSVAGATVKF